MFLSRHRQGPLPLEGPAGGGRTLQSASAFLAWTPGCLPAQALPSPGSSGLSGTALWPPWGPGDALDLVHTWTKCSEPA